ncbi:hypothetical protein Ddye_027568 [Dipteronia dyeriana]|uniref:Stigma-specific Stig1 family protein n=1 Tax=Dipteronia dyeriana TaxID=168575 RepID=A0AAD9TQ63_9ROSI|nr:hypothetical protein Ddye_027568 [Dipteronia dyeriana]
MSVMKIIITVAITIAITITLTMQGIRNLEHVSAEDLAASHIENNNDLLLFPSKRTSRFLAEVKNPRAADHCNKDNEVCHYQNRNSTCCNNKCMDLSTDNHNCGACKNKCKFTQACCRGQCVNLSFDKRHCGHCNNRCEPGQYCVYGMCDYA